jgi:hypothetical protein
VLLALWPGSRSAAADADLPAPPEQALLGTAMGVPEAQVRRSTAARGLHCNPDGQAWACHGSLAASGPAETPAAANAPVMDTTYWMRDGSLDRVYEVARPLRPSFAVHVAALAILKARVEKALGEAGKLVSEPLPRGAELLSDQRLWQSLASGAIALEFTWPQPNLQVNLNLHAQNGYPILVLGVERRLIANPAAPVAVHSSPGSDTAATGATTAVACSESALMAALAGLFPPADRVTRNDSARTLASCRDPRTVGPLAASAAQDASNDVRLEAARALGNIASPPALAMLRRARGLAPPAIKADITQVAIAAGDAETARAVLADRAADPALRTAARQALDGARGQRGADVATVAAGPADATAPPGEETPAVAAVPAQDEPAASPSAAPALPTPMELATPAPPRPRLAVPPVALVAPTPPEPPPPPPKPWIDRDGTGLAIATSIAAGGVWGGGLSLLAQQSDVGVVTLIGSAGAVIGGGTAWGLTRFGLRPNAAQSLWYANNVGWGTLAGLLALSASDSDSPKLKYSLLVGGETLGIAAGALTARRWTWTPAQTVTADSLVLGVGLSLVGGRRLFDPDASLRPSIVTAAAAVPVMLGAAVASRYLDISPGDLRLMGLATLAAGWTGGLLGSGLHGASFARDPQGQGGLMLGLGVGYLGATAAASFVDVTPRRLGFGSAGLLAGNLMGLGLDMVVRPDSDEAGRWKLGAGLGGLGLGLAAFAAEPHLHPGPKVVAMTGAGLVYGSATWALALAAGSDGQPADARVPGGMLAAGIAAGAGGFVASQFFAPSAADQVAVAAGTSLGASAGLGAAKLIADQRGVADFTGVIAGAASGFTLGVIATHGSRVTPAELAGAGLGGGFGLLAGTLIPTLSHDQWEEGRLTAGSMWLTTPLALVGGGVLTRATGATSADVGAITGAGLLGAAIGAGTGQLLPDATSRSERIGVLGGSGALMIAAGLLNKPLRLSEDYDAHALALASWGAAMGATQGWLAAGLVQPDDDDPLGPRQRGGALLLGSSVGLGAGLVLSHFVQPTAVDYLAITGASGLGLSLGQGLSRGLDDDANGSERRGPALRMGGAMLGLGLGTWAAGAADLRALDLVGGSLGAGYGATLGSLLPSLGQKEFGADDRAAAGAHLGLALGGAGAAAAAHLLRADGTDLAIPSMAGALGGVAGLGLGLTVQDHGSQAARIGGFAGTLGFAAGALALARPLRLRQGWSVPGSVGLTAMGAGLGTAEGFLFANLFASDPAAVFPGANARQYDGAQLFGASLGATTGFVLSRFVRPTAADHVVVGTAALTGAGLGKGLGLLAWSEPGRGEAASTLAGSLGGIAAGAITEHLAPLTGDDAAAAPLGLGAGTLVGSLLPSWGDDAWMGWDRSTEGSALVGASGGLLTAVALRHATGAAGSMTAVAAGASTVGLGAGAGLGLMLDDDGSRATRRGIMVGTTATLVAALALADPLRLDAGFAPAGSVGMTLMGGALGAPQGLLLAGLIDDSGLISGASAQRQEGGLMFGAAIGSSAGFLLARLADPGAAARATFVGGSVYGGGLGLGLAMMMRDEAGRADTAATLAGSLGGMTLAALVAKAAPLEGVDAAALPVGTGFGALVGALGPGLGQDDASFDRSARGGLLLGSTAGGIAAVALRKATGAGATALLHTTIGGVDGLATGLGIGILLDDEDADRATRTGAVIGSVAGLGLAATLWPHDQFAGDDLAIISGLGALGAWNGGWLPALGHASSDDLDTNRFAGGAMAGAGALAFVAMAAVPRLHIDGDLIGNALALDAVLTGAGAGAGALLSARFDAPVWGILGGGAAGLVLGGALHDQIQLGGLDAPLLTTAAAEGIWLGAFLPYVLHDAADVTSRQRFGALAAAGLGSAALATLASPLVKLTPDEAGTIATTSAIGAALAGGSALLAGDLQGRAGYGLMLGGTGAGLLAGSLLVPRLSLADTAGAVALGTLLGGSEGLVFAWAGRADGGGDYGGAGLVGAGIGAGLGLAVGTTAGQPEGRALPAGGFAAWGAWMGAFSGALANRDPHEVTLGGVAGANLGFLIGYGLTKFDTIEPRDFGWLSLFGAAGTAAGGAAGALLSQGSDPKPVLLGLAAGPAIGLLAGAIVLPHLRTTSAPVAQMSRDRSRPATREASETLTAENDDDAPVSSVTLWERARAGQAAVGPRRKASDLLHITQWMPVVGSLPAPAQGNAGPPPFVFGLSGLWR